MISRHSEIGQITILADGLIQIREDRVIIDDDSKEEFARTFRRRVFEPGDDITNESSRLQSLAAVVWTDDVIRVFREKKQHDINALLDAIRVP